MWFARSLTIAWRAEYGQRRLASRWDARCGQGPFDSLAEECRVGLREDVSVLGEEPRGRPGQHRVPVRRVDRVLRRERVPEVAVGPRLARPAHQDPADPIGPLGVDAGLQQAVDRDRGRDGERRPGRRERAVAERIPRPAHPPSARELIVPQPGSGAVRSLGFTGGHGSLQHQSVRHRVLELARAEDRVLARREDDRQQLVVRIEITDARGDLDPEHDDEERREDDRDATHHRAAPRGQDTLTEAGSRGRRPTPR